MKNKIVAIVFIVLLSLQVFQLNVFIKTANAQTSPDFYFGVDIAYGSTAEAKAAIDKVSSYTNLVVFGSTGVTWFPDRVNETFQYAYDRGLFIISLPPSLPDGSSIMLNRTEWYAWAQEKWGNRVLGFYALDEPGGKQLDGVESFMGNGFNQSVPSSYVEAASMFTTNVGARMGYSRFPDSYKSFTADYALYWYDYKAGFDTVLAEIGWNYSRQVVLALCRGAAEVENKDWGAIITWSYTGYPWIEDAEQLYDDMLLAYDNGAKYIIVFDSDENGHSTLQAEHLDAMQRFWNYTQNNQPKNNYPKSERTAFVLPDAYGFGFRWPTDHIWGIWEADELTANISLSIGTLLKQYGEKLDILYDDQLSQGNNGYSQLFYWNAYDPTPSASPTPNITPSPSPTLSPTPNNPQPEPFTISLFIAATIVIVILVSFPLIVHFKKAKSK